MKKELEDIIKTMNIYEKQDLIKELTEEIYHNHNKMVNDLDNIDGYVFGIINNAEHNKLNELTLKQLDSIKSIINQS